MVRQAKYFDFPQQKLPSNKKTKDWGIKCVDEIIGLGSISNVNYRKNKINYDLYNGILDPTDFSHVTNPYGSDKYEMPVDIQHYDIISSKINLMLGEEIKRPFNFKVRAINEDSVSARENRMYKQVVDSLKQKFIQDLAQEGLVTIDPEAQEPPDLEEIDKYYTYDYKEANEALAEDLLNYLIKATNAKEKFNEGFKDVLITDNEIYWVGEINGEPDFRLVNPSYFTYDKSSNTDYIEDSQWAKYEEYLTPGEILDMYGDELTDEQVSWLDQGHGSSNNKMGPLGSSKDITVRGNREGPWFVGDGTNAPYNQDGILVVHLEWKSMKKVGFLTFIDEAGSVQKEMVDDTFKEKEFPLEIIELNWKWIPEVWEGTKIGDDIYVKVRPRPNQYRSVDNPFKVELSFKGRTYNRRNSESTSLLDRMKPFQYEFDITMYQIRLEKSRSKGRLTIIDLAQLPSGGEYNWTMDDWLYYAEVLGFGFINSHEENSKGEKSSFNQFKDIDRSMSSTIQQLFAYLQEIDFRCSKVSGISPQREAQISPTELATNSERSIVQSTNITEIYFSKHNEVKRRVLTALLDVAKAVYKDSKKIQYVTDDMGTRTLNLDMSTLKSTDIGLFISNSTKENEILQASKSFIEYGISSGTINMAEAIAILSSDSLVRIQNKLEQAETQKQQREQQAQQQEMMIQQQAQQAQAQAEQMKMQLEQMKLEVERLKAQTEVENNIRDNQTKLLIKEMELRANAALNEGNTDMGMDPKEFDLKRRELEEKIKIEKEKIQAQKEIKRMDVENKLAVKRLDVKNRPKPVNSNKK